MPKDTANNVRNTLVNLGGSTFYERIFYFSSNLCPSRAHCFDTTVLHAYDSSMIKHALYFVINVQIDEKDRACHLCVCF